MNTATEIEIRREAVMKTLADIGARIDMTVRDLATYGMAVAIGRHVSARRARKLRRRGEFVAYCGRTSTGKARYTWRMRIAPWAIYRQPPAQQGN